MPGQGHDGFARRGRFAAPNSRRGAGDNKDRGQRQETGQGVTCMSDAMSNREIEDVLSSIRRLVAREASRPAPGRLVLTEEQRIAVNDSTAPASAAAGARGSGDEPDRDSGHEPGQHAPGEFPSASDPAFGADRGPAAQATSADAADGRETRAAPAAELRRDEGTGKGATDAAPTDAGDYGEAEEWHGPARFGKGQGDAGNGETAEVETACASAGDDAARYAQTGEEEDDSDEAAALADTLIDEDMLRALVAQLVREELRGQLGERITLLVRKLVRAEIARALDEREYL